MNKSTVIGTLDPSIVYTDRPTVKALIFNQNNEVLIINNGLLPGGGVEDNEDDPTALRREIAEEVGMVISGIKELGTIIQYRNLINRKYIINGYTANYVDDLGKTSPQDEREASFTYAWYSIEDAVHLLDNSIDQMKDMVVSNDADYQGKLYNLQTTQILLNSIV
jgi:8-oxo-dGTP pyrophosphatase MutT (NUDIX family)